MNQVPGLRAQVAPFLAQYDMLGMDKLWQGHSDQFRKFLTGRIMSPGVDPITDADCDQIIRILDRNGRGNRKACEAVARAMVPQGAWRRMLKELHTNKEFGRLVDQVITQTDAAWRATAIDQV